MVFESKLNTKYKITESQTNFCIKISKQIIIEHRMLYKDYLTQL